MTARDLMEALLDDMTIRSNASDTSYKLNKDGHLVALNDVDKPYEAFYLNFNHEDFEIIDEYSLTFDEAFNKMFNENKRIESSNSRGHIFSKRVDNRIQCSCGHDVILGLGDYTAKYKIVDEPEDE